jgi:hypothetical protein
MACCTRAVLAHSPSGMTQCRQLPALSAESLTAAEQQEEHDTVDAALVAGCDCERAATAARQGWWTPSRHRHVLLMLLPLLLLLDTLPTSSSCRICCISLLFRAQGDARGNRSAVTCTLGEAAKEAVECVHLMVGWECPGELSGCKQSLRRMQGAMDVSGFAHDASWGG